ncbi:hypothetical protein X777_16725 [Ooceraea biroi]|uniref:Uncharacterized protein n=1 Tax=Ooceraea biroi TaxID=2015173 RepID=A0A026WX07_OOCBI|nr:hypothetical protein X777_16725 [Ooceraea biroi]
MDSDNLEIAKLQEQLEMKHSEINKENVDKNDRKTP